VIFTLQPIFFSRVISVWMGLVIIGLAVATYFRPHVGLLITAAIAPLAGLWVPELEARMRGAEGIVLAFLAGALLRGWTLHAFRHLSLDRLRLAALAFAVVVAASCVHQLGVATRDERQVFAYVVEYYLTSFRGFGSLVFAMLLLEGLALLLYTAHYCRTRPHIVMPMVRILVVGALAAALCNGWFFVHELLEFSDRAEHLMEFLTFRRWSTHVGDPNAAGSYFAMTLMIAFGMAVKSSGRRIEWAAAGTALALALWMTRSRTAIVAVLLVGAFYVGRFAVRRSGNDARSVAVVIGAVTVVGFLLSQYFVSQRSTPAAVSIRWMFLQTTWRMLHAHPFFGVGIGQYPRWSGEFSSPELRAIYASENAHNNFAQIAGELGLVGLAGFLAVLAASSARARASRHPAVLPVLAGVATFVVSWLGGHPLLVPAVAYPFWIALGVIAGSTSEIISAPNG
jgi:O-antigen ligase